MPAPYIATSWAPAMYSGWRGPGMLVTVVLNTGRMRLASDSRAERAGAEPDEPAGHQVGHVEQRPGAERVGELLGLVGALAHRHQPFERVGDVGAERREHARHHVAGGPSLGLGAHRDRGHRDQRIGGQLVLGEQVGAQPAADDRQHDVVDRRARHALLDRAQVVELEADGVEHPVGGHRAAPAGARDRRRRRRDRPPSGSGAAAGRAAARPGPSPGRRASGGPRC